MPSDWLAQVQARLDETTECRNLIAMKGNLPLGGVSDIRPLVRSAEIGAILDAHGLLDIAEAAAASRSLKLFLQKLAAEYPDHGGAGVGAGAVSVARVRDRQLGRHQRLLFWIRPRRTSLKFAVSAKPRRRG